jgi:hypothetical protein
MCVFHACLWCVFWYCIIIRGICIDICGEIVCISYRFVRNSFLFRDMCWDIWRIFKTCVGNSCVFITRVRYFIGICNTCVDNSFVFVTRVRVLEIQAFFRHVFRIRSYFTCFKNSFVFSNMCPVFLIICTKCVGILCVFATLVWEFYWYM